MKPKTMTQAEVAATLRRLCEETSQAQWAIEHGFSQQMVNAVINGHKAPSPRILKALNLTKQIYYTGVK